MGNESVCICFDDERDENQEYRIGNINDKYGFKKLVGKKNITINVIFY